MNPKLIRCYLLDGPGVFRPECSCDLDFNFIDELLIPASGSQYHRIFFNLNNRPNKIRSFTYWRNIITLFTKIQCLVKDCFDWVNDRIAEVNFRQNETLQHSVDFQCFTKILCNLLVWSDLQRQKDRQISG